jgi:hypothetical protein
MMWFTTALAIVGSPTKLEEQELVDVTVELGAGAAWAYCVPSFCVASTVQEYEPAVHAAHAVNPSVWTVEPEILSPVNVIWEAFPEWVTIENPVGAVTVTVLMVPWLDETLSE